MLANSPCTMNSFTAVPRTVVSVTVHLLRCHHPRTNFQGVSVQSVTAERCVDVNVPTKYYRNYHVLRCAPLLAFLFRRKPARKNNLGRCVASRAMRHEFLKSVAKGSLLAVVHDDFNENCQTNTVYDSGDKNVAELTVTQAGLVQAMKNNPA